jgi:hypothetical protein
VYRFAEVHFSACVVIGAIVLFTVAHVLMPRFELLYDVLSRAIAVAQ